MPTPFSAPRNLRSPHLPEAYSSAISEALKKLGLDLHSPRRLADAVLKLSDYYIQNPQGATPWAQDWAQAASLAYYFPLNYARNSQVAIEAERLGFFTGLQSAVDFGSGTGSALFAFIDRIQPAAGIELEAFAVDRSSVALDLASALASASALKNYVKLETTGSAAPAPLNHVDKSKSLLMASYVYTELERVPEWWLDFEALAIIEPSTHADGRRLMRLRAELLEKGFHLWAPCTHEAPCPMLVHSERDWCHDRIHWQAPEWFGELEKHLPMKNPTLTYSYLLARREARPPAGLSRLARLTGDMLIEKGKTRQSVCRGPLREYLAWFPQRLERGTSISLERGNLLDLREDLEKKSNEIRVTRETSIEEIPPQATL